MFTVKVLVLSCLITMVLLELVVMPIAKWHIDKPIKDYYDDTGKVNPENNILKKMPRLMGRIEVPLYFFSYTSGRPEFIALWFTLKSAGNFQLWYEKNPDDAHVGRAKYMSFMMKSGISIGFAVLFAFIAQQIIHAHYT
jgi:hypothetical protein